MSDLRSAVQARLDEIVEPLNEQLREIEQQITEAEETLREAREARARIKGVLDRINPPPAKQAAGQAAADGNKARAEKQFRDKLDVLRGWLPENVSRIASNGDPDAFTSNLLMEFCKAHGVIPGGASNETITRMLDQLASEGVVRRDRIVRGGGMQWKVIR